VTLSAERGRFIGGVLTKVALARMEMGFRATGARLVKVCVPNGIDNPVGHTCTKVDPDHQIFYFYNDNNKNMCNLPVASWAQGTSFNGGTKNEEPQYRYYCKESKKE